MTKYLVTGATGFVGSHLLGLLRTINCDVRLLARSNVDNYETIICDLMSDSITNNAFESIDTVFHLAGFAHDVREPSKVRNMYHSINVAATLALARSAVQSGVKRFVFISSVKAGGHGSSDRGANELAWNCPEGVYGETKLEAETELLKISEESEMHVSIIRPSLVYGPGVKGNLRLMQLGIKSGWFPPLPETGNKRSMIHVDDLVRAMLFVANSQHTNSEVFIATDGKPYSSREIYNDMCHALGKSVPNWSVPKSFFDVAKLASRRVKYKVNKLLGDEYYSSSKLEQLGFKAHKSLKDMNETDF
ncbi:NAD-dependent epimerase/dehydratase family protein [Gammaproteobacteria bacterium]|nr:NAD-dependent epimerase/dehydratase family protein [Gammaproteobacteria bacterium]